MVAKRRAAGTAPGTPSPAPSSGSEVGVPYALPLTQPYNVDQVATIPTPDGSGQTVHPDVVDFGAVGWNGHRYWMAVTPFRGGDPRIENPCIVVSDDGFTWATPAGLTNPLDTGAAVYDANSDTDLIFDPTGNRLILTYRRYNTGAKTERIKMAHSTDGVTWSAPVEVLVTNGSTDLGNGMGVQQTTSQALVRVSASDWRLFSCGGNSEPDQMRTASDPYGPWSAPQNLTFTGSGLNPYHADVILGPDGRFWMLGQNGGKLFAAVSADGVAWISSDAILSPRPGKWDAQPYRATLQPNENGTHMRVWYSALYDDGVTPDGYYSSQDWWTGYTWMKRDHWTAL